MRSLVVIILLLLNATSYAKTAKLKLSSTKGHISIPSDWTLKENFMGMRYTILGPTVKSHRAVVSIMTDGIPFSKKEFKANFPSLQKELMIKKRGWVEKNKGEVKSIATTVDGFRSSYLFSESLVQEQSRYLICNDAIIHIKMLLSGDANSNFKVASGVLGSFKCK